MLAKVNSGTTIGLEGVLIEVEVDVAGRGFPSFTIVGLPNKAVDEAKDRVRTAIVNTFYDMPDSRITVNLAPADIPKVGSGFDLPIAVGILSASGVIDRNDVKNSLFVGELSLEGKLRKVNGIISLAILAREKKLPNLFIPIENAKEAGLIKGINIYPVRNLAQLIRHVNGQENIKPYQRIENKDEAMRRYEFDFKDIKGQEQAKRAMEIASAGFHNIHLKGVPGAGKTMMSRALPSILPPLDQEEILEVSKIYSISGLMKDENFSSFRPFRSPHHTTSRNGLIGGGSAPKPGEISLAHRGVLFLDEFPEFPREVIEAMRQPLEDGIVTISRASGTLTFPSRFLLVTASNPCPCGYLGHPKKRCSCLPGSVIKYKKKLSGPILDRIDMHIDIPPVEEDKLMEKTNSESSEKILERVLCAREIQRNRLKKHGIKTNSEMSSSHVKKLCSIPTETETFIKQAISKLYLSARSYFKVMKVSQTIADLEKSEEIKINHIAEALQYRLKEE